MRRRPSAIRPPACSATCGRNTGLRAGFAASTSNILKEFKLHGNTRLQARWEIFNVTNRVNLGSLHEHQHPQRRVRASRLDAGWWIAGNPVIGSGGPRAMQWALKVLF